jgi:hypothetical protein
LENEVAVRLRRQRRLVVAPQLTLHAVLDESLLRRPICDRKQLELILDRMHLANVQVRVVPESPASFDGLYSNFIVLSFPGRMESDLAYLEYGFGSLQIEKEQEVRAASQLFDHLAGLALNEADSAALIERIHAER